MAYSLTYSYDSTSQSYSVTGNSNITTSDKVVIPATYNNGTNGEHPVTSIGPYAFNGCSSLNQLIEIPVGVKDCHDMFYDCISFNQPVEIPVGVDDKDRESMFS